MDSRIKVQHGRAVLPETESDLIRLLSEPRFENNLRSRLSEDTSVVKLSEKLGCHVLERLASIESNVAPLQQLASILSVPKRFSSNAASQEDALQTALAAFGLTRHAEANLLDLPRDSETALSRIHILEDAVIEHDARTVPGLSLTASDLSGRAVFESRGERLEVITANKRPLENCLGVDLIYFNAVKKSIVMLQYKMLEPADGDWIYRPDGQLQDEIERMQGFNVLGTARDGEYRLNAGVFYLKCVKRDGALSNGGITLPLEHFELLRKDPKSKGPRGGIRVSYNSLGGCYMRHKAFLELIRSGYVGAYSDTTQHLTTLVDAVLTGNRAVIAAIQSPLRFEEEQA